MTGVGSSGSRGIHNQEAALLEGVPFNGVLCFEEIRPLVSPRQDEITRVRLWLFVLLSS